MADTLILFKPLADLGEALKKECPKNDCMVYRNVYERYCEEYADYKRITEAFTDLSEVTIRALEHAIRQSELELYKMWAENYAVLKRRAALGMSAGNEPPKPAKAAAATVFEAVTKDAATLAGMLAALPVIEAPWDKEFQKRYCSKCLRADCDSESECPYQQERNNPAWWLALDAAGVEL